LHLCEENSSLEEVVGRARSAGVGEMVTIGIDVESSERSRAIARDHGLFFSAGVHPNSATQWSPEAATRVAALLEDPRAVAVGETGLDFYRDSCPTEVQRAAFSDHIELARSAGAALVIHTRESVSAALDALDASGAPPRFVFHCWSGSGEDLRRALEVGAFVSFAGNVSYKGADNLRSLARLVPMDRLLVETDSPFLAPVPHRGKPNEPAFIVDVGRALAAALETDVGELASATGRNARTLFGL
jgi:TatD DNase family protein